MLARRPATRTVCAGPDVGLEVVVALVQLGSRGGTIETHRVGIDALLGQSVPLRRRSAERVSTVVCFRFARHLGSATIRPSSSGRPR